MPRNLTLQFIKAMQPPAGGNRVEWGAQEKGLGVRITAAGHRAFVLRYVSAGRERRLTPGEYPALTLTAARGMARERKGEVIKGGDPLARKRAARDAVTLGRAVERYVAERVPEQKPRTRIETLRALERHWKPLHGEPLAGIGRAQVAAARLSELAQASGPVAANRARAQLSALYRWAIGEAMAEANPVANTRKRDEKPRERVLTAAELREVWQACEDDGHGRIVRLLMLTGQRREEAAGLVWQELAMSRAAWNLPGSRTKNGLPHEVPLSDQALAVLEGVKRQEARPFLFGKGEGRSPAGRGARPALTSGSRRPAPRRVGERSPRRRISPPRGCFTTCAARWSPAWPSGACSRTSSRPW